MATYDVVLNNGRVIDPESGTDKVVNVGISGKTIKAITNATLQGIQKLDCTGLVVAPGAIDMHSHGQDDENYRVQARDGVTTALELELGVSNVPTWYEERKGKALINFGASIGHVPVRIQVMNDPGHMSPIGDGAYKQASDKEMEEIKTLMHQGFRDGAIAMGFVLAATPAATKWEAIEMFRVAAKYGSSCHVHMRGVGHKEPLNSIEGLSEIIAAASISGAPLHVDHINSSGQLAVPRLIQMVEEARSHDMDISAECYPYTAGMTNIQSPILDEGWREKFECDYEDLEWAATGERLTQKTFAEYREMGGMVICHSMKPEMVDEAVKSPLTAIASDGYLKNGKGHPRTSGCYSKILGHYVRETKTLTLMEAIRKFALMPAQRLEALTPSFKKKGRLSEGADADIIVFNPKTVIDHATYQDPTLYSSGMIFVLVYGIPVVKDGELEEGGYPGTGIRSPGI